MPSITNCGMKRRRCGRLFYYGSDRKWNYIPKRKTLEDALRLRKLECKYGVELYDCKDL